MKIYTYIEYLKLADRRYYKPTSEIKIVIHRNHQRSIIQKYDTEYVGMNPIWVIPEEVNEHDLDN